MSDVVIGGEDGAGSAAPRLSLVVPVYGNEDNIPSLVAAIEDLNARLGGRLEAVFVVDGSPDNSAQALLAARERFGFASKIALHSRNFGSFTAIRTGLELATGEHFAAMAADLQEPPELILRFFEVLERGEADVVFGQRTGRSDSIVRDALSSTFWWLYRRLVIADIPPGGVDIFACNRAVRDVLLTIREPNSSLIAQLFWVGFRRTFVPYERRKRLIGKSAWNVSRRLRYMMDSIFSFSDLPILLLLWFGVLGCLLSLGFGVIVVLARLVGFIKEPGYATIVLLLTFFGSASLAVQGVLGSYLWRTFENTKQRPLRILSDVVEREAPERPAPPDA
ncbi:glycosyltransferase family 2 protein [Enterovirga rhinocerotis]|uniref:Glycosyltransferase involved in cell wall biosynthesis n=1 Tax=Enterovirga rhinocerotis TaxID=1339210 RepID=A0A4R7C0I6_9HYPH|nr:glycosyltransferase family 2 protein [Enterovirga rhinocerotis]TDR89886.1 glycosyltransferase involved in cell wall biosynthesis [Enterovirga rhinocerotis]